MLDAVLVPVGVGAALGPTLGAGLAATDGLITAGQVCCRKPFAGIAQGAQRLLRVGLVLLRNALLDLGLRVRIQIVQRQVAPVA